MVIRERVTIAVLLVLIGVGGWFAQGIWQGGLESSGGQELLIASVAIAVLTSIFAGAAALMGGGSQRVDERDRDVMFKSQVFRGFLYLSVCFGLLGLAVGAGDYRTANALFLAVLAIEIVSGLVMLALYRISA